MAFSRATSFFHRFCNDDFRMEDSTFSFSNDLLLPSLGAQINQTTKLRKFIVSPFDPKYRYKPGTLFVIDNVVNAFFAVDIILTFFLAYVDHRSYLLIDEPKKIAKRYLSTWFVFDVCSTAPLQPLSLLFNHQRGELGFKILNMLRLWRLRRVSSLFARLEKDIRFNYFWTRCTKLISRDTVRAASEFAARNLLPERIEDQMLSHICLRFKTEGLKQQQTLNDLPKAIRSHISNYLFFPVVQKVHLFQGVSCDFLFQLVTEMQAEYFPPKEDVILQNEAPTDLYILVSGSVDLIQYINGGDQDQGRAISGEIFGEIGVLCHRPQPFTARTRELSQILRLSMASLMNIVQANMEDGIIIMNNLLQQLKGLEGFSCKDMHMDPQFLLKEWLDGVSIGYSYCPHVGSHARCPCQSPSTFETTYRHVLQDAAESGDIDTICNLIAYGADLNSADVDGQTALHVAACKGYTQLVRILVEGGADVNRKDASGRTPKTLAEEKGWKDIYDILQCYENKVIDKEDHRITVKDAENQRKYGNNQNKIRGSSHPFGSCSQKTGRKCCSNGYRHVTDNEVVKIANRRVTIHMCSQKTKSSTGRAGKMIILPHSIEELLRTGGQKFSGSLPTKVLNAENAEIDDIDVIRDGDHLFLLESE